MFFFLILSNFLEIDQLKEIFWENLFECKDLEHLFAELIGEEKHKPFECVGTLEESFLSMYHALEKYGETDFYILQKFKRDIEKIASLIDIQKLENKLLKIHSDDIIPQEFKHLLK